MSFHALRFLTESSKVNWMEATRSSFLIEKDEGEGMHQPFAKFFLRTTDNSVLLPWRKRVGLLLFAMLQNGLTGGVLFGWASIDKTMLTTPGGKGSGLSFHETTLIFSWASCVAMVSSLILGVVLDCYGPRICSIVSSLIIAIGCQVFALSRSFSGLAFGACLIAFGGPGITSSIIHIANIFPGTEYLVMSCLSGSIALSFSVFAVFDAIWARFESVTFRTLFSSFSLIVVGLAIGAFLIYPDEPFGEFEEDLLDEKEKLPLTNESVTIPPSPTTILYNHHLERNNETCEGSTSYGQAHHDHIKSVAPASLKVEQPLNSFLRDSSKILQKTESFFASKTALGGGADVDVTIISLKDKPFYQQLISTSYFRSSSVFLVTSFVTNFYVASISTELADLQDYNPEDQHDLTCSFTITMSMGLFASVVVGWLIDEIGLEICTAMTLVLGQLQMILLLLFGDNRNFLVASFWVYTMFRQFLYPVYIASLTSNLGFKYFGVLLGIGFAVAGCAQLLQTPLLELVKGDCHAFETSTDEFESGYECGSGYWRVLHFLQFSVLGCLLLVPVQDYRYKILRESTIKEILSKQPVSCSYGTNLYGTNL